MGRRGLKQRQWRTNLALALLLMSLAGLFAGLFVASERTFHFSDWAFYEGMAIDLAAMARQSPAIAYDWVQRSLDDVYNRLYILPLLPLLLLFGETRLVYILGLVLLYLVPLSLVMGAIAVRLIAANPHRVFWSSVCVTLLFPALWIPTLQGYPDVGGALLLMGAVLVFVQDIHLKQTRQALGIGALLASAILFRRHFAYDAVALLGAIAIHSYGHSLTQPTPRQIWAQLRHFTWRLGAIVATMGGLLSLISWKWVYTTLTTDYRALYASYTILPTQLIQSYTNFYGYAVLLFAIIGFCIGLVHPIFHRPTVRIIGVWLVLCVGLWIFYLRYLGAHYTLNFSPQLILGIVLLLWFINSQLIQGWRLVTVSCMTIFLGVNAAIGLTPLGTAQTWPGRTWFSTNHAPVIRADYDELVRLVQYLHTYPDNVLSTTVATTVSSLSPDLPRNAERQLYPKGPAKLQGPVIPTVDSGGWYPLPELMKTQRVVLTEPFEHILAPADEEVIKVTHDIFTENWELAQDFRRLPAEFTIQSGSKVYIYERLRPTSTAVAVRTLATMQDRIRLSPGTQLPWLVLKEPIAITGIRPRRNGAYWLKTVPADRATTEPTQLLYIGPLQTRNQITGQVKLPPGGCPGLELSFTALDRTGRSLHSETVPQATSGLLAITLDSPTQPQYLLMTLTWPNQPPQACPVELEQVAIAPA